MRNKSDIYTVVRMLVVFCLLLAPMSLGAKPQEQSNERTGESRQPEPPAPSAGIDGSPPANSGEQEATTQQPQSTWWAGIDWGSVPSWLGLLVTVAAVVAAFRTIGVMGQQTEIANSSVETAKANASTNALAMKAAYEASSEHLRAGRIDLRAWVGVTAVDLVVESGKALVATVHVRNTGKTPARNCTSWASLTLRPTDKPFNMPTEPQGDFETSAALWTAGCEYFLPVSSFGPISDNDQRLLVNDESVIDVCGKICYVDVFGEDHWVSFAFTHRRSVGKFMAAANGNDCD